MKKTVIKHENGTKDYYFGDISHIVKKQTIDWDKVVATATVDEKEDYPEI